ncbi:MAG: AAA family ATPase, partial [Stellaceae bacterium]
RSDHHHRFLAAAIARQLAKGYTFVLLVGETGADGELIERFLAEEGDGRRRASLVRCHADMDFRDIVRAYNRALGLGQEPDSGGLWTLLAHLMLEARNGITRVLLLDGVEALDLRTFDELLRFSQLDGPHVMPVVLLTGHGVAERLETPPFEFLRSAIAGRVEVERLEPEEVAAFIQCQLNALGEEDAALFPPATVSTIAAACGGSPAEVNRLARVVLDASRRGGERDTGPSSPFSAAADEPPVESAAADEPPEESAAAQAPPAVVEPIAIRAARASPAAPRRWKRRLLKGVTIAFYVAVVTLSGQALLYLLAPRAPQEPPATVVTAVPPLPAAASAPGAADVAAEPPPPPPSEESTAQSGAEAPASAAAQAPAIEPASGPSSDATAPAQQGETAAGAAPHAEAPAPVPPAAAPAQRDADIPPPPQPAAPPQQQAAAATLPKAADEPKVAVAALPAVPAATEAPSAGAAQGTALDIDPAPTRPPHRDAAPGAETPVMVRRGEELLAAGDIVSARRFFERAAFAGDAAAECGLAKSYDPLFLRQIGALGLAGDAATAVDWYRRAAAAGSAEAIARLERLRATPQ